MSELIDTTEMYLKTVYELEEDGVPPLRARIVERLAHSGPTVSQTVSRMERMGLLKVNPDRSLELTEEGRHRATEVIRKHRLAERLLLDVIGLDRRLIHEEACRWEHVMSEQVEERLAGMLEDVSTDPFGNPVPQVGQAHPAPTMHELSAERAVSDGWSEGVVARIGEPIQADSEMIAWCEDAGLRPGVEVSLTKTNGGVRVTREGRDPVVLPDDLARHLFLRR